MLQSRQCVTSWVKKICSPNLSRNLSSSDVMRPTLISRISICFLGPWHLQNEVVECVCFGLDNYQMLLLCLSKLRTVSWQRQSCLQTLSCVSSIFFFQGYIHGLCSMEIWLLWLLLFLIYSCSPS